jgi:hypothetical protein
MAERNFAKGMFDRVGVWVVKMKKRWARKNE